MRDFGCFLYHFKEKDVLIANSNTACFAGLEKLYKEFKDYFENNTVYIKNYTCKETKKYIPLIVETINKITPCEIVEIKGCNYIKFTMLETYNQSLILLNFIRTLWYSPYKDYSEILFEKLLELKDEDALVNLTTANKYACEKVDAFYCGHSNCHPPGQLAIRKTEELLAFKGYSTSLFLRKKYCTNSYKDIKLLDKDYTFNLTEPFVKQLNVF